MTKKFIPNTLKHWKVFILPNNQPDIFVGNYYAKTRELAIEIAATDNQVNSDKIGTRQKLNLDIPRNFC